MLPQLTSVLHSWVLLPPDKTTPHLLLLMETGVQAEVSCVPFSIRSVGGTGPGGSITEPVPADFSLIRALMQQHYVFKIKCTWREGVG